MDTRYGIFLVIQIERENLQRRWINFCNNKSMMLRFCFPYMSYIADHE
jgi:hypothetical protein